MTDPHDVAFEMRNTGDFGVGGCLTAVMLVVFGGMPLMLVAMTFQELGEEPVLLPIFWLVSLFPLAVLYVLRRLMRRYAVRLRRDGGVELILPFKTIRIERGDLAAVRTDTVNVATPASAPARRRFAHFIAPDRQVKGSLAMSAFRDEQWQEFFARLAELRPDVEIGAS
jgi:hypothetical protein